MKLKFFLVAMLAFILGSVAGWGQGGAGDGRCGPIPLTGWNRDVVFENARLPAAASFDSPGERMQSGAPVRAWFEAGLEGHVDGLPSSRRFTSAATTNVLFELQPYTTNNVLFLTMSKTTGTLVLTSPKAYRSLFILAAAAGGNGRGTLQLGFREGAITRSSKRIGFQVPDWWVSYPASYPAAGVTKTPAITGLGRSIGAFKYEDRGKNTSDAGFALYQAEVDLAKLDLHEKPIQSLAITMDVPGSVTMGIFAVSGAPSEPPSSSVSDTERR